MDLKDLRRVTVEDYQREVLRCAKYYYNAWVKGYSSRDVCHASLIAALGALEAIEKLESPENV